MAVFFVASLLGSSLLLIHVLLPLTAYMGLARLFNRQWRWFWRCVGAATAGLILSLVFILPAFIEQTFSDAAVRAWWGGCVRARLARGGDAVVF